MGEKIQRGQGEWCVEVCGEGEAAWCLCRVHASVTALVSSRGFPRCSPLPSGSLRNVLPLDRCSGQDGRQVRRPEAGVGTDQTWNAALSLQNASSSGGPKYTGRNGDQHVPPLPCCFKLCGYPCKRHPSRRPQKGITSSMTYCPPSRHLFISRPNELGGGGNDKEGEDFCLIPNAKMCGSVN